LLPRQIPGTRFEIHQTSKVIETFEVLKGNYAMKDQPEMALYQQALQLEQEGDFARAFNLFYECLSGAEQDRGDLLFHCGWCLEQDKERDARQALSFYREAGEIAGNPVCRMNSCFRAGWLLMHLKEYAGAGEMYLKAVRTPVEKGAEQLYTHAAYWLAVCLEVQGRQLEALQWFRSVQQLSPQLSLEARFREICCLNRIGAYAEALEVCRRFDEPAPPGMDEARYRELRELAEKERRILESCLAEEFF